jgi:hypothetical protein
MARLLTASFVAALAGAGLAAPAAAEVLSLQAEIHGGGGAGVGVGGDRKDDAFHDGAAGGIYGAKVGVELLFLDAWIEHDQFRNGDGLAGTWTEFMLGLDLELELGQGPIRRAATGEREPGKGYLELGLGAGFGVGTGQQVDPPLDNAQITDKGFLVQGRIGVGYRLNKVFSLGLVVPVEAGYLFKSGDGLVANDTGTHYQSVQAAALLNLRMTFTLK